jgi:hypothetical protein
MKEKARRAAVKASIGGELIFGFISSTFSSSSDPKGAGTAGWRRQAINVLG